LKKVIETVGKDSGTAEFFVICPKSRKRLEVASSYFSDEYEILQRDYLMDIYEYAVRFDEVTEVTILFNIGQRRVHSDKGMQYEFYVANVSILRKREGVTY